MLKVSHHLQVDTFHPGMTLKDFMTELNITIYALAQKVVREYTTILKELNNIQYYKPKGRPKFYSILI